jgi:hypothetical protein
MRAKKNSIVSIRTREMRAVSATTLILDLETRDCAQKIRGHSYLTSTQENGIVNHNNVPVRYGHGHKVRAFAGVRYGHGHTVRAFVGGSRIVAKKTASDSYCMYMCQTKTPQPQLHPLTFRYR